MAMNLIFLVSTIAGIDTMWVDTGAGSNILTCANQGDNFVELWARDVNGQESSLLVRVTVNDTLRPTPVVQPNIQLYIGKTQVTL